MAPPGSGIATFLWEEVTLNWRGIGVEKKKIHFFASAPLKQAHVGRLWRNTITAAVTHLTPEF